MGDFKEITAELKKTKKIDLSNFTHANLREIAYGLVVYELIKKGETIRGWKYLESHELMEGSCLFDGSKFISLNRTSFAARFLFDKFLGLEEEYLEKVKYLIETGTYDRDFMAKYINLDIIEIVASKVKSILNK